jgi:hypothetical protein
MVMVASSPSPRRRQPLVVEVTFCVQGVISPLLSNLYLNEVDRMLERAREVTRNGKNSLVRCKEAVG